MDCSPIKNLDFSEDKMDTTDGKLGEKSMESEIKPEEKAKNIPLKVYREISPIKSKKGKSRKMIAKSATPSITKFLTSGGKKEESGEKKAVSEGPTTGEVPKISKFFIRIIQTNF